MVGLRTEQLDICCGQVIGNTRKENIFILVILRLIDDNPNTNHIICLDDIFNQTVDLKILSRQ